MKDLRTINEEDFYKFRNFDEKIKFLLNYAVIAPSTHNSQPWLFKISPSFCEIYKNNNLALPYADPLNRDLYISIGCALENLILASKYFNVYEKTEYIFENNLIARVYFKDLDKKPIPNEELKEWLLGIKKRLNARGMFKPDNVPSELLNKIKTLNQDESLEINLLTEKTKIEKMAELIAKGLEIAYRNKNFRQEMSRWINNSLSRKKEGIPGYALKMPLLLSFVFPFMIKYLDLGKKLGKLNYLSVKSAPVSCLISSKENSPLIWCKVGQLAERIMVFLAANNLESSIFVSAIEMGLAKEVAEIFETDWLPQFHFCFGYMDIEEKFTPRHSVEEKIINDQNKYK